jgi:hypothetical protein
MVWVLAGLRDAGHRRTSPSPDSRQPELRPCCGRDSLFVGSQTVAFCLMRMLL